jgi:hypothetical protein
MSTSHVREKSSREHLVSLHRKATEQRILELLAIEDLPRRIAEFGALYEVVTDERKALAAILEFLHQQARVGCPDTLSENERDRLARWVGALGFTFPNVLERLAHAFATEFGKNG